MNTNELLKEIYDKVMYYEPDIQEAEKTIGEDIRNMVSTLENLSNDTDRERICDMLYYVQHSSMREGYILGAAHTLRLIAEILSGF